MVSRQEQAMSKPAPRIKPRFSRLALFGGAFDPIHCAHLAVARSALAFLGQAEVCFIPAAHSPLKQTGPLAGDSERLAMLARATAGEPRFLQDDLEIRRGGCSYSVDTVGAFREAFPGTDLYWILGADQFEQLPRWYAIDRLVRSVCFLVVGRPRHSLKPPRVPGLRHERVDGPLMSESSSEVRKRCQHGQTLSGWVPPEVEAFISNQRLYSSF